jgi:hypothetical protein
MLGISQKINDKSNPRKMRRRDLKKKLWPRTRFYPFDRWQSLVEHLKKQAGGDIDKCTFIFCGVLYCSHSDERALSLVSLYGQLKYLFVDINR